MIAGQRVGQLIVRKLKEQAGLHGTSMEKEHRRILRDALLGRSAKKLSFTEDLLQMPEISSDSLLKRRRDKGRPVKLVAEG